MTRLIKFRVWNGNRIPPMDYDPELGSCSEDGRDVNAWLSYTNVMQFTGLYDKNGEAIYHKDIIRLSVFLYTVEWDGKAAKFYLKSANEVDTHKYTMAKVSKHGVVEGNIYEHPNLIRDSKLICK